MPKRSYAILISLLAILLLVAIYYGLSTGAVAIAPQDLAMALGRVIRNGIGDDITLLILFRIRLPRILLAIAVGASLSISGAGFQGFFRNPLADPYVIGASSGAALGAAIALVLGWDSVGILSAPALAAFVGALVATLLAFVISRSAGNPPPAAALLLAGTALSALFSSLLSLVLVLKDKDMHRVYHWLLGSLGGASWKGLAAIVPVMFLGCAMVLAAVRPLDLMIQGEDTAVSLGLDIKRARIIVAAGASLAAAAAVSAAGIIGFVGLVAPHAVRLFTGPAHRKLMPAAALGGALLVLAADIAARSLAQPMELPIGIVTSAVGAPFFLYLLARRGAGLGKS